MKKILSVILAATLIIGFVNHREKNIPKGIEKEDQVFENRLNYDIRYNIDENNGQNEKKERQIVNINNKDMNIGIEYVKNNDFDQLSENEKANIYSMATNIIEKLGYDTSDFSYDDLNYLYIACQDYMIKNNVDANSLSVLDQAKLYNILSSYLKNKD
jgi:hypothetical protein